MRRFLGVIFLVFLLLSDVQALASNCTDAEILNSKASRLLSNSPQKAVETLTRAVKLCPGSSNLLYNYGLALYESGDSSEAALQFKKALALNRNLPEAYNGLAIILLEAGDLDNALLNAEMASRLSPQDKDIEETFAAIKNAIDHLSGKILPAPRTAAINSDAIAVVIGNQQYNDKSIPRVEYALNDALAVKQYLINTLGFKEGNIIFEENATKAKFEAIFGIRDNHRGRLHSYLKKGKSSIFVYYSGHGAPDMSTQQGYFVPYDADSQAIAFTGYPLKQLYENLAATAKEMNSPDVVVVVDACFSGATEKGLLIKNASPIVIEFDSPVVEAANMAVITSSSGSEISSWYPEHEQSLFTYFFLKAIKNEASVKNEDISISKIFSMISDETEGVPYYARRLYQRMQTPQVMGNADIKILSRQEPL